MAWMRKTIAVGFTLSVLAAAGAWFGWRQYFSAVQSPAQEADTVRIIVEPGSSLREIGQQLKAEGVLRSPRALELWMRWQDLAPKAGTFDIDPRWPLPEIAKILEEGRVVEVQFTIPEGWRLTQMAEYFEELGWFSANEFMTAAEPSNWQQFEWLPDDLPHLEGWLFPNTYRMPLERRTPELVISSMLQQFETEALPLYQAYSSTAGDTASSGVNPLSLQEWVTLASIVEKEAVQSDERPEIAGVFTNRLEQGIPLAADPTVEYAFNIVQTPDRRLTFAEVEQPSPYNTYLNAGLPPTAIASPGLASLSATLAPAETDNLYFVARYDGSHVFSRTLDEHLAAQRQIIREREIN